jgi:hypothetical protein
VQEVKGFRMDGLTQQDLGKVFGHDKKKGSEAEELMQELNVLGRRLRVLEEQYTNIRRKIQVTDQNMLTYHRKNVTELKTVNMDINELRRILDDMQNNLLLVIKELRLCAKKEEVSVLQKYINMWEPINFVSRKEVENIVEDKLDERKV